MKVSKPIRDTDEKEYTGLVIGTASNPGVARMFGWRVIRGTGYGYTYGFPKRHRVPESHRQIRGQGQRHRRMLDMDRWDRLNGVRQDTSGRTGTTSSLRSPPLLRASNRTDPGRVGNRPPLPQPTLRQSRTSGSCVTQRKRHPRAIAVGGRSPNWDMRTRT